MKTDTYRELFFDKQNELLKALQKAIELQEIIKGYEMAIDEVFKAYPQDIFPDTTQAERDAINDNDFISRTSAMMGRHIAKVIRERAYHFAREIHEDGQAVEHVNAADGLESEPKCLCPADGIYPGCPIHGKRRR